MKTGKYTQAKINARRPCVQWPPDAVARVVENGRTVPELIATDRAVLPAADCAWLVWSDDILNRGERKRVIEHYLARRGRQELVRPKWMDSGAWDALTPRQVHRFWESGALDGDTVLLWAKAHGRGVSWRYFDPEVLLAVISDAYAGKVSLAEGGK